MAWGDGGAALVDRFAAARSRWDHAPTALTYQGFIKALLRLGLRPLEVVRTQLRERLIEVAGPHTRRMGFFVLAVDGSRFDLPRTAGHERVFGVAGKTPGSPRMWVTMLWHLGVGLPWDWRLGRAGSSERDHLRRMLDATPANTLIVADAGFTGYDLLRTIVDGGRDVLIRVGRHVRLLTDLHEVGEVRQVDDQTVWLWPASARQAGRGPLVLRLIAIRDVMARRRTMYLLTSVREPQRLSDEQAATLYRLRWGVELGYRALKQTLESRKLRSAAPANALFEMHGLLLGLSVLGLLSVAAIVRRGHDPLSWSVAASLRAVRQAMRGSSPDGAWREQLGEAVKDRYERHRKVRRHWPRKKSADPPPGRPRVRPANSKEIHRWKQMQQN